MKIELLAPHEHAGRDYQPGQIIDVADADGEWLISLERAKPAHAEHKAHSAAEEKPKSHGHSA